MDAFQLLTGGIKFNKQRFSKDISVFKGKPQQPQHPAPAHPAPNTEQQASQPKSKKRKHQAQHRQQHAAQEGAGISVFTKSNGATGAADSDDPGMSGSEEEDDELSLGSADLDDDDVEGLSNQSEDDDEEADSEQEEGSDDEDEQGLGSSQDDADSDEDEASGSDDDDEDDEGPRPSKRRAVEAGDIDPGCPVTGTRDVLEAANLIRKHYRIKVSGSDPCAPLRSWRELVTRVIPLYKTAGGDMEEAVRDKEDASHVTRAVQHLVERLLQEGGWSQPTPIQRQAVPSLMSGRELLAVAPTGSGKTLAFLIPVLLHLKTVARQEGKAGETGPHGPRALLLSPTHELAAQQARVVRMLLPGSGLKAALLTKATAIGNSFRKVDILLANPARLATLVEEKHVDLSQVRFLVLDEADKLFDMGFVQQIDALVAACTHSTIIRALFSATLPEKVEQLARSVLKDPLRVTVGVRNTATTSVKQRLMFVGHESGKLMALRQLIAQGLKPPVLVFVATKERAKALHKELLYDGVHVDSINSAQSHSVRTAAVDNFRSGKTWVLIATDLIGRGMDFIGVQTVINYDFPSSTSDYIHRVGRTGRGTLTGEAVTFFTEDDSPHLRPIANLIKESGGEVPDWMLAMKRIRAKDRKHKKLPDSVARGATISSESRYDRNKRQQRKQHIQQSKDKKAVGDAGGAPARKPALKTKQAAKGRSGAPSPPLKKKAPGGSSSAKQGGAKKRAS